MKRLATLCAAVLVASSSFAADPNLSVKVDTNGVLRFPLAGPFAASNNLATATSMNASNTADRAYALGLVTNASIAASNYTDAVVSAIPTNGLTNGVGSGCTVTTTGKTFYVSVVAPTGTAASVDADLQDHKTNATAHSALFDGKLDKTATNGAEWGSHAGLLTEATSLGATNATGGILTFANRMIGLTTSAISNAMAGVYSLAGHIHQWTEIVGLGSASTNNTADFMAAGSGVTNHAQLSGILGSGNLHVSEGDTNRIALALTNTPTLQQAVDAGNGATNVGALSGITDVSGTGRRVFGAGLNVTDIAATAVGSSQSGWSFEGTQTIGADAYGASQSGYNIEGTQTIGIGASGASQSGINRSTQTIEGDAIGASQSGYNYGPQTIRGHAYGARQSGFNNGTQVIGTNAYGASQRGDNGGTQIIGNEAYGAQQIGKVASSASATNNGVGAMQLLDLTNGQSAVTTVDGDGSILLGAGTASNRYAIVAGDGQASHGDGSITAGGGFYGSGANLTGITAAQVAAAGGLTNGGATVNGGVISNGAAITISGGGYTNYIPAYVLASAPTTTITRAMGELVWINATSAITKLTIDNAGWDTNGAGRVSVDLYGNNYSIGFDTTVITNSTLLDISTNVGACTPLFFRRPAGATIWRVRQ